METAGKLEHPGQVLKRLRLGKALTLNELAKRTLLPASTLSKLENGKMTLTYDKLLRLGAGLQEDLGRLLSERLGSAAAAPVATGRRSVVRAEDHFEVHFKVQRHRYAASDLTNKLMLPIMIDVTAKSVKELGGLFSHKGEEYIYVLEGAMELHSELYEPLVLETGDSVYFDSAMAHAYVLRGDDACRVLVVCAGQDIDMLSAAAKAQAEAPPETLEAIASELHSRPHV